MTTTPQETKRTTTHEFRITRHFTDRGFEAGYQSINPRNGKLWQATKRIVDGADVQPEHWDRPILFSTIEAARAAVERQITRFTSQHR